ncbi:BTD.2 family protein [Megaselia abdita]
MIKKQLEIVLFVALLFVGSSYQQSKPADDFYYAAVVEYFRTVDSIPGYMKLLDTPEAKQADIIVFPEATLNKYGPTDVFVPHHNHSVTPCGNSTYNFLADFSCKAKEMKKYIVLNLFEKERCTAESQKKLGDPRPCPASGWNKFNTNVVLDRNGMIIARYRKVHLYGEPGINTNYKPDIVTFDTDFGVTFGTFICFDILFETPAQNLVKDKKITDFVYPIHWRAQLPFFTSVQTHQAWAYANNVNLLAAGANEEALGSTGTAVFAGKNGAIVGLSSSSFERTILLAKVPKIGRVAPVNITKQEIIGIKSPRNLTFTHDDSITFYESKIVEFVDNKEVFYKVCQKDLCCSFNITRSFSAIQQSDSYVYRVGALNMFMERFGEKSFVKNCGFWSLWKLL